MVKDGTYRLPRQTGKTTTFNKQKIKQCNILTEQVLRTINEA
jgi:hypothetical protein